MSKPNPLLAYTIGVCVGTLAMAISMIVPSFGWGLVAGIAILTVGWIGVRAALCGEGET